MRISDWSSDVCSSDLSTLSFGRQAFGMAQAIDRAASATFRNGVRPSGILSTKDSLTAEQRGVAENLLQEKFAGSLHAGRPMRSEEHTSELQSLMRISYAVFCLKKKNEKYDTE